MIHPFLALSVWAVEITESQLLISGLASGIGLVAAIIKWVVASPERESAAYKQGIADEGSRCKEETDELRAELIKVKNALLSLAVAADLTIPQRMEIAQALGLPKGTVAGRQHIEGDGKGDNLGSTH